MAINLPENIEQYIQLIGEGKKHKEIANIMHVKKGTVEGNYRSKALELTGLTSTEELVLYAKQNGLASTEEEPIGTDSERLSRVLRGPAMEPVRDFYRRLEIHYLYNRCQGCTSYHQYGVMVVSSHLEYHLEQFCTPGESVRTFLDRLKKAKLIEEQTNEDVSRITFTYLAPKEEAC